MNLANIKQKIAYETMMSLTDIGVQLQGKRVLDVGFGLGYNTAVMQELGAMVYGVEPDVDAFMYAVTKNHISADNAYNTVIQDLPAELYGTFDVVTLFLYNIPFSEREIVFETINRLRKPTGIAVFGLHDKLYIQGDRYTASIPNMISRFFEFVKCRGYYYNIGNKVLVTAM